YIDMSRRQLGADTCWVVWNETTVLGDLSADEALRRPITAFAQEHGVTVLTGMLYYREDGFTQNALAAVDAAGITPPYCKQRLVPFGESIPFAAVLQKWWPQLSVNLLPGSQSTVLATDQGTVAALICYESIFAQVARANVRAGGEIIVLVTNDAWFGDSPALRQHLAHARLRAVESGRWMVHAANSGISCFVSPTGQISGELPAFMPASTRQRVGLSRRRTLYSHLGDAILLPGALLMLWDSAKILSAKTARYGKMCLTHKINATGGLRHVFSGNRGGGDGAQPLLSLP
ncbi:MAG: apolipoprotein N-acyltransferase, partial [Eubacteriales bacterium]|nr:apolipoprotein N-acyltransferase [Eubacteriales bacterium]